MEQFNLKIFQGKDDVNDGMVLFTKEGSPACKYREEHTKDYTVLGTTALAIEKPTKTVYKWLFTTKLFPNEIMLTEGYYESEADVRGMTTSINIIRPVLESAKEKEV